MRSILHASKAPFIFGLPLLLSLVVGCKFFGSSETGSETAGKGGTGFKNTPIITDSSDCGDVPAQFNDGTQMLRFGGGRVVESVYRKVHRYSQVGAATWGGHAVLYQSDADAPPGSSVPAQLLEKRPNPAPANGYRIAFEDSQNADVYQVGPDGSGILKPGIAHFANDGSGNLTMMVMPEGMQGPKYLVGASRPEGTDPILKILYAVNGACFGVKRGVENLQDTSNDPDKPKEKAGGKAIIWLGRNFNNGKGGGSGNPYPGQQNQPSPIPGNGSPDNQGNYPNPNCQSPDGQGGLPNCERSDSQGTYPGSPIRQTFPIPQ